MLFGLGCVAGLGVHLDVPAERRLLAQFAERALNRSFLGTVEIGAVEALGVGVVAVRDVEVLDPLGQNVLSVGRLRADLDLIASAVRLLGFRRGADDALVLRHVSADRATVALVTDEETGAPTLLRAFAPRESGGPRRAEGSATTGPNLWLPSIELGQVHVDASLAGLPRASAEFRTLRGSVLSTAEGLTIDVERVGVDVSGLLGTRLAGTAALSVRSKVLWGQIDGFFGNVQGNLFAHFDGERLALRVDAPRIRSRDAREILAQWPLEEDLGAHVEAEGVWPVLRARSTFTVGGSRIEAAGDVRLHDDVTLDLQVLGRDVDVRSFEPEWPKTDLEVRTRVRLLGTLPSPRLELDGRLEATAIAGTALPAVDFRASVVDGRFTAQGRVHEHGMPLDLEVEHQGRRTDLTLAAASFRLQGARRLQALLPMRGRAELEASAVFEDGKVSARVEAALGNAEIAGVGIEQARVTSTASGVGLEPLKWQIHALARGEGLARRGFRADRFQVELKGPWLEPNVAAAWSDRTGREVEARARWLRNGRHVFSGVDLDVRRGGRRMAGSIDRVSWSERELVIDKLVVSGDAGELSASVTLAPELLTIRADSEAIDIGALSTLVGLPAEAAGTVRVALDVTAAPDLERGRLDLEIQDGLFGPLEGLSGRIYAELREGGVRGEAALALPTFGNAGAVFEGKLAGRARELGSWRNATGRAEVQWNELNLLALSHFLPEDRLSVVDGKAYGSIELLRSSGTSLPRLIVREAGTYGLKLLVGDPAETTTELSGLDLKLSGSASDEEGDVLVNLQLVDANGPLLTGSARTDAGLRKLFDEPARALARLAEHPFSAVITLPERRLETLPPVLYRSGARGLLGGRVQLAGTPNSPVISLGVHARELEAAESPLRVPVEINLHGVYAAASGDVAARAELLQNTRRVLLFTGQGRSPWQHWFEGGSTFSGNAQLTVEGLDLASIKAFSDLGLGGVVRGSAALKTGGPAPVLYANAHVDPLSVLGTTIGRSNLFARSQGARVSVEASADNELGHADARLRFAWEWVARTPRLIDAEPLLFELRLRQFDAVAFAPVTRDVFADLGGPLTGNIKAVLVRREDDNGESSLSGPISGRLVLEQGFCVLSRVGLKLEGVRFSATATGGETGSVLEIRDFLARADSETPNVAGRATVRLDGVEFREADADVELGLGTAGAPKPNPVPLPFEGVRHARLRGAVRAELRKRPERMDVLVSVPRLVAELTDEGDRSLIRLERDPDVRVLQPLEAPAPAADEDSLPWKVELALGDGVEIQRTGLRLGLRGRPEFALGNDVTASGALAVKRGGTLRLGSRPFVVERGEVRFETGDPSNPFVQLWASWRAPDTTTFNLELRGTLDNVEPHLSSDPPSTNESEAWAKLLGLGGGETATDVGLGIGTDLLGKAFAKTPLELRAGRRAAAVQPASANPAEALTQPTYLSAGLAYRVSDRLSIEGSVEKRETTPLASAEPDSGVTGTVDYRINPNWSLRTDIGTIGAGVDLLWQHRY